MNQRQTRLTPCHQDLLRSPKSSFFGLLIALISAVVLLSAGASVPASEGIGIPAIASTTGTAGGGGGSTGTTTGTTGGISGPHGPGTIFLDISPKTQVLQPDPANKSNQLVTFTATISGSDPGYDITEEHWSTTTPLPGGFTAIDSVGSLTTTATATAPGQFNIVCTYTLHPQNGAPDIPNNTLTAWCLAYGGPITISVVLTGYQTYLHDGAAASAPFFLEYFGYDGETLGDDFLWYASTPLDFQAEQRASASVLPQADGVELDWYIPSYTDSIAIQNGDADDGPEGIDLFAIDAGAGETVTCSFGGTWIDPGTGAECPLGGNDDTTASGLVNGVSGHKPDHLAVNRTVSDIPGPFPVGDGLAGTDYYMQLYDTAGGLFPGVLLQEYYPVTPPANFTINRWGTVWTTRFVNGTAPDGTQVPDPDDGDLPPPGTIDGDGPDTLQFVWLESAFGYWAVVQFTHIYFAATADYTGAHGVSLGPWIITFTPPASGSGGGPLGGGPFGTATQSP